MRPFARQFLVGALKVTFFVILAAHQTMAGQTCAGLYTTASSVQAQSFLTIRDLFNSAGGFFKQIQATPDKFTVPELALQIQQLERLSKKYFDQAGLSYEPQEALLQVQGLKGTTGWQQITYSTFHLTGSRNGDDLSRMIFGVQSDRDQQSTTVQFYLDPLFELRNEGDLGHFRADSNTITFGSFAVLYRMLHLGDTLRHEIQHYFEFLKLLEGQMTLNRLEMNNMAVLSHEDYATKLEGDELESHLRELRLALNPNALAAKDKFISALRSEEKNQQTANERKTFVKVTIAKLERLAQSTKHSLSKMEAQLTNGGSWAKEEISKDGKSLHVTFKLTKADVYPIIKLNLTGLLPAEHFQDKAQIRTAVQQAISWSQRRVAEVENELQEMKSKP